MAKTEITLIKATEMATVCAGGLSSAYGVKMVSGTANGAYLKCTGIDPSRVMFVVTRNSSECSSAGAIYVIAGSVASNEDYEGGRYSTLRNFTVTVNKTTNFVDKGSTGDGSWNMQFFRIPETARFLDTDQYIKMEFQLKLTSASNKCHGAKIGAILLPQ